MVLEEQTVAAAAAAAEQAVEQLLMVEMVEMLVLVVAAAEKEMLMEVVEMEQMENCICYLLCLVTLDFRVDKEEVAVVVVLEPKEAVELLLLLPMLAVQQDRGMQ